MISLSRKEAIYEDRQDVLKVTRVEGHNEEAAGDFEETMHRTSSSNFRRPLDDCQRTWSTQIAQQAGEDAPDSNL